MSKRKASSEADRVIDTNLSFDDISVLINNRQSSQLKAAFENESLDWVDINLKSDDSLLMKASRTGDEDNVAILLEYGADISFESHYSGHTALSLACLHGHESIVKLLLKHRADPNTPQGYLPLIEASKIGSIAIVELLLGHGAKVDTMPYFSMDETDDYYDTGDNESQYRSGPNALMIACSKGYTDLAHVLLRSGANVGEILESSIDETQGFTALTFACQGYHWELVKQLIGQGADVNEKLCDYGLTPLMYACTEGNLDAVKMLLNLGADINQAEHGDDDSLAPTPLSAACLHGHIEVAKYILDHQDFTAALGVPQKAFIEACEHGDAELIALLRPRLGDLNDFITPQSRVSRFVTEERTLLTVACGSKRVKATQKLLELGATVSVNNDRGFMALASIWMGGPSAEALIALLVEHGADVNSVDNYGYTPLMRAANSYLPKTFDGFKALLDYGADVRAKTNQGRTVLDMLLEPDSHNNISRRNELIALCKQYEESNRRDRPLDDMLLK